MKINIASVAGILTMVVTTSALAQEMKPPSSTFVEAAYVYSTASVGSPDIPDWANSSTWDQGNGFALKGSVALYEELLLRGSYFSGDGTEHGTDTDVTSGVVSVGWLIPTDDAVAIDIGINYRMDNVKFKPGLDEDISGLGFGFGVRAPLTENTEFGARLAWYQGDFDGTPGVSINFAYNIDEQWGINVFYDYIDADTSESSIPNYELIQFGLGGRFYF
ncbi:MAG: hypothetical protein GY727_11695 [Gammaproteobacteria bacterium]|nr:hypothetical protein [Gammaproteobacteria bacterium]MCP4275712.1 hypothetical protein [Gammaproteobacteria bacterium]MCP4831717.1 hypothetical protein [Gammaproteobacteria bacterium]MCP4927537.1 hypothetical protein [Gammaproteobacteria bacterium]